MTKAEIKTLVNSAVKGQGNQTDLAGKLDVIINAIVDIIPDDTDTIFTPKTPFVTEELSAGDAVTKYGLTDEIFDKITNGLITRIAFGTKSLLTINECHNGLDGYFKASSASFANGELSSLTSLSVNITLDGKYQITFVEPE